MVSVVKNTDFERIRWFDSMFSSATYRVIHSDQKSPVGYGIYGLDAALEIIKDSGKPYRLGWVVDSEHIVIDVDCDPEQDPERKQAITLFNLLRDLDIKMVMYSTKRGAHFIFKSGGYRVKNVTKALTALGITVDIRAQGSYVILPFNDHLRKWWLNSRSPDTIPEFLKVITYKKDIMSLWGLKDGDGRNDALFNHLNLIRRSQLAKLESEAIKQTLILTNKYILGTPMSDRELYSTVLRPDTS